MNFIECMMKNDFKKWDPSIDKFQKSRQKVTYDIGGYAFTLLWFMDGMTMRTEHACSMLFLLAKEQLLYPVPQDFKISKIKSSHSLLYPTPTVPSPQFALNVSLATYPHWICQTANSTSLVIIYSFNGSKGLDFCEGGGDVVSFELKFQVLVVPAITGSTWPTLA